MGFIRNKTGLDYKKLYPLFFTLVFVVILTQYSFSNLDVLFYDLWQRYNWNGPTMDEVIVVAQDEESDEFLGEFYPYSVSTYKKFYNRVMSEKPKLLLRFGMNSNPVNDQEKFNELELQKIILESKESALISGDREGQEYGDIFTSSDEVFRDDSPRRLVLSRAGEITKSFQAVQTLWKIDSEIHHDYDQVNGTTYDYASDTYVAPFRSGKISRKNLVEMSFHRVAVGNFPRGLFKGKIVIVGPKYISRGMDYVTSDWSENGKVSSLAFLAHGIMSLKQIKWVRPIDPLVTKVFAIFISIVLSIVISRMQPSVSLIVTIVMIIVVFLLSYLSFCFGGYWFRIAHIVLSIFVVYYIWVPFRAIEEYQTRFAIQEEAKILKRVDNLKQNFISLMSHDLKTPVAKISAIVENLLRSGSYNEKQEKLFREITSSVGELNNFISSILDLVKIESETFEIRKVSKDINNLLSSVVDKLSFEADAANIKIDLEMSPLYPISVDAVLIQRVFSNIIENSIKYSRGSEIKIRTWDDNQFVFIEIADNGQGIPFEEQKNIFDKFYRVKNDEVHSVKGTGLGLYLVRYFIELHGGQISLRTNGDGGASFTIKLKNA